MNVNVNEDDVDTGHRWRELYETVMDLTGTRADARGVLERWLREHPRHVAQLREAGRPEHHASRLPSPRDAWWITERLYALGRVLDVLLLTYQAPPTDPSDHCFHVVWPAPDAYPLLCHGLGAQPIGDRPFHPFFHEVVEVEQSRDPDERPTITHEHWPGYLLDSMLLARTGVTVRAGSRWLVAGVADRSALYWTYRRRTRQTNDLSYGWGSNSQWRTCFRRDYLVDGMLHYNVDAGLREPPPFDHADEIGRDAMREVLRHRCSTVVDHGDDLFPYDEHHVEPAPRG